MESILPLEKRLRSNDPILRGLPEIDFEDTRKVGKVAEVGRISVLMADGTTSFQNPTLMIGIYYDATSERHYLIHTESERPHGGFPQATSLEIVDKYEFLREYGNISQDRSG